jgi:leucine carboxyl methyltransferase
VPVDFEAGDSWWERLVSAGFDGRQSAVVASTGVSMYLSKDATAATLRQLTALAGGSTLAMTFLLPIDLLEPEDRRMFEWAQKGAAASGTPFATLFAPDELIALAREAGFKEVRQVSGATLAERYFSGRTDGLRPASGEVFLSRRREIRCAGGPEPSRSQVQRLSWQSAVEPDRVLRVSVVWQLAALAEVVDVCGRAAEQRSDLDNIERSAAGIRA